MCAWYARRKFTSTITNAASRTPGPTSDGSVCVSGRFSSGCHSISPARAASAARRPAASASPPFTRKPMNGRRITSPGRKGSKWPAASTPSTACSVASWKNAASPKRRLKPRLPLQEVEVVHVHGLVVAEDRDDDREPDRGLRRGHRHHEEHEQLTLDADHARERDEGEVHRVQHQLDAQE